jgi:hypothetical protein
MPVKKVAIIIGFIALLIPVSILVRASMPNLIPSDPVAREKYFDENPSEDSIEIAEAAEKIDNASYEYALSKLSPSRKESLDKACSLSTTIHPRMAAVKYSSCRKKAIKSLE